MGDQCIFSHLKLKQLQHHRFKDLLSIVNELKIEVYLDYTRQFQTSKLIFSFRHT